MGLMHQKVVKTVKKIKYFILVGSKQLCPSQKNFTKELFIASNGRLTVTEGLLPYVSSEAST